jgi:hypothetical protein
MMQDLNIDYPSKRRFQTHLSEIFAMKKLFTCSTRIAVPLLYLGALNSATTAGSFTRGCAAYDLQILMLIEERESTNTVSAERLSDAMLAMINARMICYEVHLVDARAIYDRVAASLTPGDMAMLPDRAIERVR